MPKRFLNIERSRIRTRINVTDMEDLSEVIIAIKTYYGEEIPGPAARIQLYTANREQQITDLDDITPDYYKKLGQGGSCALIGTLPPTGESSLLVTASTTLLTTEEDIPRKRQHIEFSDLTTQYQTFSNAQLVDGCLKSPNDVFFPYPQSEINKLYVRKCYEDVFALILKNIKMKSFAISGTPGIGKSLFFVYILYRLIKDFSEKSLSLKPNRIVYHRTTEYTCFNLENQTAVELDPLEAKALIRQQDTLYIIDGNTTPFSSTCITLFISSPRSGPYKEFVKQTMAMEWFFPVWTSEELQICQIKCYPHLSIEVLKERYRVYGGVARFVFHKDFSIPVPKKMKSAINDVNAVRGVKYFGETTDIFPESHSLLHILVGDDEFGNAYQFIGLDVASKYVGEQLWILHSAQMITNLQEMFGGSPNEISRHLFEIYGHMVFSVGGRTLKCRCLEVVEDTTVTEITLDALSSHRITFGKDTIPTAAELTGRYYEPMDDDNFPAVDSLSTQGMFQYTVDAEHPIRGGQTLGKLCKLYDEPKLYFVVPPHRFEKFKKQSFKAKEGTKDEKSIFGLKQYVVELPVIKRH